MLSIPSEIFTRLKAVYLWSCTHPAPYTPKREREREGGEEGGRERERERERVQMKQYRLINKP